MLLFLVGLLALLCQVVLLRELNVAFFGVELVYAVALAAWMAGCAAGAAVLASRADATSRRLSWLLALTAVALPAEVAAIRVSRLALGGVPGAYLPFEQQMLVLAAAVLPPSLALGAAFPWAARLAAATGRTLAWAYAVESAGAAAGAASATAAFALGVPTFTLAVSAAGFVPLALLVVRPPRSGAAGDGAAGRPGSGPVGFPLPSILLLLATPAAVLLAPRIDLRMTAWSHPSVVESRDSPYARITVTSAGSQTALFVDDVLVYESEGAAHEEIAHIAALSHPAPRRILLLGGSVERIDRELRRHGPDRLDVVELDRTFVEAAGRRLPLEPGVVFDDPRDYLRRSGPFDLIVVATAQPTSGQSNRFYTVEFFAECRRHLAAGGVLAFRLEVPENVMTPLAALRAASVLRAARSAFPHVELLQASSALVVASGEPLPGRADELIERWQSRGVTARLVTPSYLRYLFENDRRAQLNRLLDSDTAPNSDARPVAYQVAAATWLAKFFPGLLGVGTPGVAPDRRSAAFARGALAPGEDLRLDRRVQDAGDDRGDRDRVDPRVLLAGGAAVLFALVRRLSRLRAALLAGVAGLAGMALETVLLLAYQARSGALFERLGVLLMAFMVGLAAGAWGTGRLLAGRRRRCVALTTATLLVLLAALGALTVVLVATGAVPGLALTGVVLLGVGATVAGVFACAAALSTGADAGVAGRLYGADLAGGALGSLAAGLLLIPTAGLVPTTWLVVGLSLLALLLV